MSDPLSAPARLPAQRSSLAITLAVWKALLLREALTRLFSARAAWVWVLIEPIFHVAYLVVLFTVVRVSKVGGIDTALWIMIGLLAFFTFERTGSRVHKAIPSNRALFAYRQVKIFDPALVRAGLEAILMVAVSFLIFFGASLLGLNVFPADPLLVLVSFLGLWLLGFGFGLLMSVAGELISELERVVNLILKPLYLISGVVFPLGLVPSPYRGWLMINPVAHGLEIARFGFAPYYHAAPEASLSYLYAWVLVLVFFGLFFYRIFYFRLSSQ